MERKLVSLKAIKLLFDIALVVLSLGVVLYIVLAAVDIATSEGRVTGFAIIEGDKGAIELGGDVHSSVEGVDFSLTPKGVRVVYEAQTERHPVLFFFWKSLYAVTLNLVAVFIIFVLYQIRNMIKNVCLALKDDSRTIASHIFSHKNVRGLRRIAYGFMLIPLVELVNHYVDRYFLMRFVKIDGVSVVPVSDLGTISWEYILVGLLFIVMIEVFRRGIALQEENDLTV